MTTAKLISFIKSIWIGVSGEVRGKLIASDEG